MGLFKFKSNKKNEGLNRDTTTSADTSKNVELESQTLDSILNFLAERPEPEAVTKQTKKAFQEYVQQEQTRNGQQNTDKVDSPISTENPIVPDENNINEETTQIDLNEIYKELNTTENELISKWSEEELIPSMKSGSRKYIEFKEWVIEYYKDNLEKKPRSR